MISGTVVHLTGMRSLKFGALEHYLLRVVELCNEKNYRTIIQYESMPSSQPYLTALEKLSAKITIRATQNNPLCALINCIQIIVSHHPDIIHVHFVNKYVLLFIPILARIFGVRKILSTVHYMPSFTKKHPARFVYNMYNHVLPVSKVIYEVLKKAGVNEQKLAVHYWGILGERTKSPVLGEKVRKNMGIPIGAIVFGCIAFDDKVKGVDILLEAFQEVSEERNDIHLIIIGINPAVSSLPALAANLKISSVIHWAGIVDNGWQILNAVDIYIQPSRSEGIPLAVIEAMALRLPVVCTKTGCAEAVQEDGNAIVTIPNKVDLAEGIKKILSLQNKWPEMGELGYRRFRELFDGEKSIKILIEKYYV